MGEAGKTLVTGANGLVGRALVEELSQRGHEVLAAVRSVQNLESPLPGVDYCQVGTISGETHWQRVLRGVEVVVHCAGLTHAARKTNASDLPHSCRVVNRDGTLNLARQAAAAGVRRFVFMSSVKVNGEHTENRSPFRVDEPPAPEDAYGKSKRDAEEGLRELAMETGLEVVIIRPPLIYGPGVQGNFQKLIALSRLPLPLPFGAVDNLRSMIFIGNLVDFVIVAAQHPNAANQAFLVSDGQDLSTKALLCALRRAQGRKPRLWSIPVWFLYRVGALLRKRYLLQRLCGTLQVDIADSCLRLAWKPPFTVEEGVARTVNVSRKI